jgi:D-3-phosphoglycerate dehydrogenase
MVSAPYAMPDIERYRSELEAADCEVFVPLVHERLEAEDLMKYVGDVHGIICGDDRITAQVLDAAPKLRVISKWGTGIDSIDSAAAKERGVHICNTPNAFSEPVADTAIGYMLQFARRLDQCTTEMREGIWNKPHLVSLGECTIGIVGVGNCGSALARRLMAFGSRILGHDTRAIPTDVTSATGLESVSLEYLLQESDFVSLHTDLNPTSHHLIGEAQFKLMKPTSYLINTARGPVIDEAALIAALRAGLIAGAALDVFEDEPLPTNSPFRAMSNVQLAPHTANNSPRAAERVHVNTIRNLLTVLEQSPL